MLKTAVQEALCHAVRPERHMPRLAGIHACACFGRFIPVYNAETHGAERLRGGEHGVGDNRQGVITEGAADSRQELAERGLAGPGNGAPAGFGLPGQVER